MQKILKLSLDSRSDRPLFELGNYKNIGCLLDTGAGIAVWCADIQYFREVFSRTCLKNAFREMCFTLQASWTTNVQDDVGEFIPNL